MNSGPLLIRIECDQPVLRRYMRVSRQHVQPVAPECYGRPLRIARPRSEDSTHPSQSRLFDRTLRSKIVDPGDCENRLDTLRCGKRRQRSDRMRKEALSAESRKRDCMSDLSFTGLQLDIPDWILPIVLCRNQPTDMNQLATMV